MLRRTVVPAAMALLLAGCGFTESAACTQIAAQPGIAVTVEPGPARSLTKLTLTVCSGSKCRTHQVKLAPGSDMVDQGCVGTDPDAACSATAVPNQTLVGFVEIAGMTEGPLRVSGRRRMDAAPPRCAKPPSSPRWCIPTAPSARAQRPRLSSP